MLELLEAMLHVLYLAGVFQRRKILLNIAFNYLVINQQASIKKLVKVC